MLRTSPAARPAPDLLCGLLVSVGQGSQSAFEELYSRMSTPVYSLALGMLRQPALALEVCQEIFLQCWQQAARFDPALGSGRSWLLTIAHHKCVDVVRRERRRTSEPLPEEPAADDDVARAALSRLLGAEVLGALQELPFAQQQAIALAFYGGYTHGEIARQTGHALGTVKTRIRDGLQRLRSRVGL